MTPDAVRLRYERAHQARFTVDANGVVAGAETIHLRGEAVSGRAALLVHGFNDTPQSMEYLATALHRAGWSVLVPRLSGHGVTLPRMARESRASRWLDDVRRSYDGLCAEHPHVVVVGQSMGGALSVLLAAERPTLPALVLLAPFLGMRLRLQLQVAAAWVFNPFTPYRTSGGGERSLHDPEAKAAALGPGVITARTMTELRKVALAAEAALGRLTVPTLYLQSREDNRIRVADAERAYRAIGSRDKVQRWLSGCGHIISADYCRDAVAAQVIDWFDRHLDASTSAGPQGGAGGASG